MFNRFFTFQYDVSVFTCDTVGKNDFYRSDNISTRQQAMPSFAPHTHEYPCAPPTDEPPTQLLAALRGS